MMRLLAGFFALVVAAPAGLAGPLSKVVHGIDSRAGQDDRDRSGPSQGRGESDSGADSSSDSDSGSSSGSDGSWGFGGSGYGYGYASDSDWRGGGLPPSSGRVDAEIYLALHRVAEETGAAVVALRAAHGDFALELSSQSYVENAANDVITLGLWSVGGGYRVIEPSAEAPTSVWLSAAITGLSTDASSLVGVAAGARLRHHLTGALGLDAGARLLSFQSGIEAVEARAGVAASLMRVSYRYLRFDVGPPLHGPEVGIALLF